VSYVSANKWRITVIDPGSETQVAFGEIEWRDKDGIDLTGTGTAAASNYDTGFEPDKAFDDDVTAGNGWMTEATFFGTATIDYDFGAPVEVRSVKLTGIATQPTFTPTRVHIEYWDGAAWVVNGDRITEAWVDGVSQVFKVNGIPFPAITEAPEDGKFYLRKDGAWSAINHVSIDATTAYDVASSDNGSYRRFTNAGSKSVGIRTNAVHALPNDGEWHLHNNGAGSLTIIPAGGVTVNLPADGTLVVPEGGTVTIKRVASDEFDLFGQVVKISEGLTFPDYTGNTGKVLTVNATEDGVEWDTPPASYTSENARDDIGTALTSTGGTLTKTVDDPGNTINLDINTTAEAERIRDVIGSALVAGTGMTVVVDDGADTITLASTGGGGGGGGSALVTCRAYNDGAQAIANATASAVTFNTNVFDTSAFHNIVTNTSRFVIPVAGKYRFSFKVSFAANATGTRIAFLRKNGVDDTHNIIGSAVESGGSGTLTTTLENTITDTFNTGDYIELFIYQTSGGALNLGNAIATDRGLASTMEVQSLEVGGAGGVGATSDMLIEEWVADGTVGTKTFSAIPQTYKDLILVVVGRTDNAAGQNIQIRANGLTTATYDYQRQYSQSATASADQFLSSTLIGPATFPGTGYAAGIAGYLEMEFHDYKNPNFFKQLSFRSKQPNSTTTGNAYFILGNGQSRDTNPVTSLTAFLAAGNFVNGSTIRLYGRGGGSSAVTAYNVPFGFSYTPVASEVLLVHAFSEAVTFQDEWLGSVSYCGTNPTASFTMTIKKISGGVTTTVGTIVVSTGGVATLSTSGSGTLTFNAGDVMRIEAPGVADTTIANFAATFKGQR
jgi:hypothetical protein